MAADVAPRAALLDTDTLSAVLVGRASVHEHALAYLQAHTYRFTFSVITRYEILKGLHAKGATAQAARFEEFCTTHDVRALSDAAVVRAAEIYADLHRRGALIGDADILIAATAMVHGLAIVTNNVRHFRRIPGLDVANWLA